jgi:hypothetical protein
MDEASFASPVRISNLKSKLKKVNTSASCEAIT